MTAAIIAGSYYLAETTSRDLGMSRQQFKACAVVTPAIHSLTGVEITEVHTGPGAGDVPLQFWRDVLHACRAGVWPGPATEPTWPQPKENQ